jgi:hypothetical protein
MSTRNSIACPNFHVSPVPETVAPAVVVRVGARDHDYVELTRFTRCDLLGLPERRGEMVKLRQASVLREERIPGDLVFDSSEVTEFETAVLRSLASRWQQLIPRDAFEHTTIDPRDIAERMIATVPRENPFNDAIGPFYDTAGLTNWLNVQKQRLTTLRQQRRLLAIKTTKNRIVYPAFQFGAGGELLPHLSEVVTVLESVMENPLSLARWLNTPSERFDGMSAAAALRAGRVDEVVAAARQVAASLSR